MESVHVVIDETNQIGRALQDDDEVETFSGGSTPKENEDVTPSTSIIPSRLMKDHNLDDIIGDIRSGDMMRRQVQNLCAHYSFVFQIETKNFSEAETKSEWRVESI